MEVALWRDEQNRRLGFTTGSCAALAAKAAALALLSGIDSQMVSIKTPKGLVVEVPVETTERQQNSVCCTVRKMAGDDPDATDGVLVAATVMKTTNTGISIEGGAGVGRVTRKGLDQPVGAAAINSVPRQMIADEVAGVCRSHGYAGGLCVVVSIPQGELLAAKTFNPMLGIVGGISVLGTSGIVEPMSTKALLDTIKTELNMHKAEGTQDIILSPGNYGQAFLEASPEYALRPVVKCSNFVGPALDMAAERNFSSVLLVGHIGKFIKLAGGIMDTHSKTADCRMELLALYTALAGANIHLVRQVLNAATTDAAIELLDKNALRRAVMDGVLAAADANVARRVAGRYKSGVVIFSCQWGFLGASPNAQSLLRKWRPGDVRN